MCLATPAITVFHTGHRSRATRALDRRQPSAAPRASAPGRVGPAALLCPGPNRRLSLALEEALIPSWKRAQRNGVLPKMTACRPSSSAACRASAVSWGGPAGPDRLVSVRVAPQVLHLSSRMVPPLSAAATPLLGSSIQGPTWLHGREFQQCVQGRHGRGYLRHLAVPRELRGESRPSQGRYKAVACASPPNLAPHASVDLPVPSSPTAAAGRQPPDLRPPVVSSLPS